jgi:hypothetical protein
MFSLYPYNIEELEVKAILANYIIKDNTKESQVCNSVSKQSCEVVKAIFSTLFRDIRIFSEDATKQLSELITQKLTKKTFKLI